MFFCPKCQQDITENEVTTDSEAIGYIDKFFECEDCEITIFTYKVESNKEEVEDKSYKKVVLLEDNMLDEEEREIFQACLPYTVQNNKICNEDGLKVGLDDIWVDFTVKFIDKN